jgi:D-3-phosphoglycerate dehydrogenase / 2-oxoglutarate reductase
MKVLITTSSFGEGAIRVLEKSGFEVINNSYKRKITQAELVPLLEGVQGVIAGLEEYTYDILSNSKLEVVSRCGSGLSNIDMDAAKKLGISVYNTPEGPTQSVAELTIGCLLSLIRDVPRVNNLMHSGKWEKSTGHMLKDMKVLLIGYGRIGKTVAKILDVIGANVYVCDPFLRDNDISENFIKVDIHEGIKIADAIILHSSGEDLILGEKEFEIMKPGVFILNVARGGLIDEKILEKEIKSKRVAGAWLDTFQEEPYNGNLLKYSQVILTPHIGSYTIEGRKKMEYDCVNNLLEFFKNKERVMTRINKTKGCKFLYDNEKQVC